MPNDPSLKETIADAERSDERSLICLIEENSSTTSLAAIVFISSWSAPPFRMRSMVPMVDSESESSGPFLLSTLLR